MRALDWPALLVAIAAGIVVTVFVTRPASGQVYPSKAVRIVAGSTGTTSDIVSRHLGQMLNERWRQGVVVENRGGASAVIAADLVAKAAPDGYTLLMGQFASHAAAPSLYRKLPYDPVADFAVITLVAKAPLMLIGHPSVPAPNLRAFIDYARMRPGTVNYSAGGSGTASNLTMVLFRMKAGLDLLYVPYKGASAALTAILAREAQVSFVTIPIALPHVVTDRVKAYAITAPKRFAGAPDVPTAHEAGMPGFESTAWFGMFAPSRTPPELIGRLNREIGEILRMPLIQREFLRQGAEATPGTPEEFSAFVRSEIVKWRDVIKAAGIESQQ